MRMDIAIVELIERFEGLMDFPPAVIQIDWVIWIIDSQWKFFIAIHFFLFYVSHRYRWVSIPFFLVAGPRVDDARLTMHTSPASSRWLPRFHDTNDHVSRDDVRIPHLQKYTTDYGTSVKIFFHFASPSHSLRPEWLSNRCKSQWSIQYPRFCRFSDIETIFDWQLRWVILRKHCKSKISRTIFRAIYFCFNSFYIWNSYLLQFLVIYWV